MMHIRTLASTLMGASFFSIVSIMTAQTPGPVGPGAPANRPGAPTNPPARRPNRPAGLGAGPAEGYGPQEPAAIARGKQTFVSRCAFCHGANATGGEGGPDLIRSTLVLKDRLGSTIAPVVQNGRGGMPRFDLTNDQIGDISQFLHSKMAEKTSRGRDSTVNIVTGNAKAGEAYFNGPGTCSTCHSVTGDLAHIASKYEPRILQGRMIYPNSPRGASAPGNIKVTVTDASGASYSGTLEHLDDFTVSLRDAEGEYHSWNRTENNPKIEIRDPRAAHQELMEKFTDDDMHNVLAYLETLK
ncbi:MAG: c-type cytochrome [Acidobacteriaceae bacterium]|nr:c-type cytochrome [Acidobacteriaceae bacterium]